MTTIIYENSIIFLYKTNISCYHIFEYNIIKIELNNNNNKINKTNIKTFFDIQ